MRLVCPNCEAEYEVDGTAIPWTGREVQCSNCNHAWFQAHPEVLAARDDEKAPFGAPEDRSRTAATVGVDREIAVPKAAAPLPEPQIAVIPPLRQPVARNIDDSVLSVLREEAERETAARRAETAPSPLEIQTEMPLEPAAKPSRSARPAVVSLPSERVVDTAAEPGPVKVRSRRDLFPAIDEVNSTLRAASDRAGDAAATGMAMEAARREGGGFGRGILTVVLIGVILLALYVFAPVIGTSVPALAGWTQAYMAGIDAARLWLDGEITALVGLLRGFEGNTQG